MNLASAVRASNIVTVQTQTPHGLVTGDQTVVSGVTGGVTAFNGTFTVTYVNLFTFTYSQAAANESATVNTGTSAGKQDSLGIGLGIVFTDPTLIPYLNSAYRTIQRGLAMTGATLFRQDNIELVVAAVSAPDPAVQTSISEATAPPNNLPSDLLEPLKLWERPSGSTDVFVDMVNMTYRGGLLSRLQTNRLMEWEWRADGLFFVGATQDVQIRMRYRRALANLVDGTSTVSVRNAQEVLGYYTAALAAAARGSPLAQQWNQAGDDSIEALIAASTREQQFTPRRRRAYGVRRGAGPTF